MAHFGSVPFGEIFDLTFECKSPRFVHDRTAPIGQVQVTGFAPPLAC